MRHLILVLASLVAVASTGLPTRGQILPEEPIVSAPLGSARPEAPLSEDTGVDEEPAGLSPRNASYDIEVRLDHESRSLTASETISWRNISARPTSELQFHLYWNAWRNAESTWLRERRVSGGFRTPDEDDWGWIDIQSIRVREPAGSWQTLTPALQFLAPDDGNALDRTVAMVPLTTPVQPGGRIEIDIEWTARVPRTFARTGHIGDYYFIGQWFPKLGVLEDEGWNTHQFHAATEFYADFGVYDVQITVPEAFVVGASGREMGRTRGQDGMQTHRYRGEDLHDFAWTASPSFIDETRTFEHPTLPDVAVRLLLQPERRSQADRYFTMVNATLQRYGEWFGPYPYGYLTIVDPAFQSGSDGMEYPTLVTGRSRWLAPRDVQVSEMTVAHEVGHQWWQGMVATNETEHAWMDEGINTFATARVLDEVFTPNRVEARFFGGFVPWSFADLPFSRLDNDRIGGYRRNPEADAPWTPTFRYWPATASTISYNKTSLWLHTLERQLGWPMVQQVLATYFDRWKFKHPTPTDFFSVVRDVTGQGHVVFFDEVYRSSNTFDYGVQTLQSERLDDGRYRTTVVIARYGEALSPVDVLTTFSDGTEAREAWTGQERRVIYVYERAVRAVSARVDPERTLLLDVDYTNNSRTLLSRSREASVRWSLRWMGWLQDLMLTYAFFV